MNNLNEYIDKLKLDERNRCIAIADDLFLNDIMSVEALLEHTYNNLKESIDKGLFWATYTYTHQIKAKFLDEMKLVNDHAKLCDFIKGLRYKIQDALELFKMGNITLLVEYMNYEKPYTIDIKFTLTT